MKKPVQDPASFWFLMKAITEFPVNDPAGIPKGIFSAFHAKLQNAENP